MGGTLVPPRKEHSFVIIILLLTAIFCIFIVQIPLQKIKVATATPRGADVAVIGGTTAALLSALNAAENGAQVFLFLNGGDPAEDISFLVSGGLALAQTPPQKELEIEFGPEIFEKQIKQHGGEINDPYLLRAFVSSEGLYAQLGERSGFFFDLLPQPENRPYFHLATNPHTALFFKQNLLNKVTNSPIIISDEEVEELLFSSQGQLEALLLNDNRGESAPFYIQSVILADGGYGGAAAQGLHSFSTGNLVNLRNVQNGKGLRWAEELGFDMLQTGFFNTRLLLYLPGNEGHKILPLDPWEDTYFFNTQGQFLFWMDSSPREALNFILNSSPDECYILVPEDRVAAYEQYFIRFDNLGQLMQAHSLELPPQFSRMRFAWQPCFAALIKAGADYALGGISITPRGEVKKDEDIVKGLYAAGEIVGGLHGGALLPGMALSETLFLSNIAGQSAAIYSQN